MNSPELCGVLHPDAAVDPKNYGNPCDFPAGHPPIVDDEDCEWDHGYHYQGYVAMYWNKYTPPPVIILPGDLYEDCAYRPLLCISIDHEHDELIGISLIDGLEYRCSINHCGAVKMTLMEAVERRQHYSTFVAALWEKASKHEIT